jgi:hypothetical protein
MRRPSVGLDFPGLNGESIYETKAAGSRGEYKPIFGSRPQSSGVNGFPWFLNVHCATLTTVSGIAMRWRIKHGLVHWLFLGPVVWAERRSSPLQDPDLRMQRSRSEFRLCHIQHRLSSEVVRGILASQLCEKRNA